MVSVSLFHHSVIRPTALQKGYRNFMEIGVSGGKHTEMLLELCSIVKGSLVCIDPVAPPLRTRFKILPNPKAKFINKPSLEALPELIKKRRIFDLIIVDGDHNWYTVFNELLYLSKLLNPAGTIHLHDVAWPYARRDMYYLPERIPQEFRHQYARRGIIRGQSELVESGGLNPRLYNAQFEGGPRNGVYTAIEDFIGQEAGAWNLHIFEENFGLGCLTRAHSESNQIKDDTP